MPSPWSGFGQIATTLAIRFIHYIFLRDLLIERGMLDRGVVRGGKGCIYIEEVWKITCAVWIHGSITVQMLLVHFDRIVLATKAMSTVSPIFNGPGSLKPASQQCT